MRRVVPLRGFGAVLAGTLLAIFMASGQLRGQEPPVIAAAASLQFALEDIAEDFEDQTGEPLRLSFGSSGNLMRQIRQGAGFAIFLSADEAYALDLVRAGFAEDDGVLYAVGRLALVVPDGSSLQADGQLEDLQQALEDGRLRRFAIANPEHAPYGMRAREVLEHKGLWQAIQPKLLRGENVSQAAQFATSGNADGGLVAYSLAVSPKLSQRSSHALVPEDWHKPLRQRMIRMNNAGPVAERFYAYLQSEAARRVFRRYGFLLPGESLGQ
ncbi:molybdate ABC transporter substrate-binding protein [Fodinicurvata sediminis]|uniref:molybdate ABC transporter substrate-binding protein n=1 Tax=Fodinicurvata sediminis TaxID=1121832 RepID=UPI00041C2776|nr:molybdate ABC transporter substrate-binding protein [Fodinicurvata sediminis]